jgi:hypothetical protein
MELLLLTNIDFDTLYNFLLFSELINEDFNFMILKIKIILYNCSFTELQEKMLRSIEYFHFLEGIIKSEVHLSYDDCHDKKGITWNCQGVKPRENKNNYYVHNNWLILFNPNIKSEKHVKDWLLERISSYFKINDLVDTDEIFWRNLMSMVKIDDFNLNNVCIGIYNGLILVYIQDEIVKKNHSFFKPKIQYIKLPNPIPQREFRIVKLDKETATVLF